MVKGGKGEREPSMVASRWGQRSVWRAVRDETEEGTGGSVAEAETGDGGAGVGAGPRRAK